MRKKIICIAILGIFLFASVGSAEIVFKNESYEKENQNVLNNELKICYGKFYSNGHIEFIKDPDFSGTIDIPHGYDVTVYCDYEIVDTLTPGEFWEFHTNVFTTGNVAGSYDEEESIAIWDEYGDDSQTGVWEFTIPLEKFILGADEIHHWSDGSYEIPWLNYSEYCYTSHDVYANLLNENPNKPSLPEGPTCLTARAGGTTETVTYTVDIPSDPDGDDIIKYKWLKKDEDDDYWGPELIRDQPSIELNFHYNRLVGEHTYLLKVQVQDSYLTWSEWSEPLEITIRRVKSRSYEVHFLEHMPMLKEILERLFG